MTGSLDQFVLIKASTVAEYGRTMITMCVIGPTRSSAASGFTRKHRKTSRGSGR